MSRALAAFLALLVAATLVSHFLHEGNQNEIDILHTDTDIELQAEIDILDERIRDLEYEVDIAQAAQVDADLAEYLACYHDPTTETWPNLPIPATGEC